MSIERRFTPAPVQPVSTEWTTADDIFLKSYFIAEAGMYLPQHSHEYDHTTIIASGAIEVWEDGAHKGEFAAPAMMLIKARTKHLFKVMRPATMIICAHNAARPEVAKVVEAWEIAGTAPQPDHS